MSGYLFFQIPGQHDTGVDKDRNKDRTYDGGFQPVFALGGVGKGEDQGQKIHAHQQYYAHKGQNPFEFTVFHSSVYKKSFLCKFRVSDLQNPFLFIYHKKEKSANTLYKRAGRGYTNIRQKRNELLISSPLANHSGATRTPRGDFVCGPEKEEWIRAGT